MLIDSLKHATHGGEQLFQEISATENPDSVDDVTHAHWFKHLVGIYGRDKAYFQLTFDGVQPNKRSDFCL